MCQSIPMSLCTQRYVEIQLYLYIQNLMQEVFLLFITLQTWGPIARRVAL